MGDVPLERKNSTERLPVMSNKIGHTCKGPCRVLCAERFKFLDILYIVHVDSFQFNEGSNTEAEPPY